MRLCIPVLENRFLESEVSGHFGKAPAYLLVETADGEVAGLLERGERGRDACAPVEAMLERGVEAVACPGIGGGAMQRLRAAGVPVYQTDAPTVEGVLEEFAAGLLREMEPGRACAGNHHHGHHEGHVHC